MTSPAEAGLAAEAGADALCVQGYRLAAELPAAEIVDRLRG